MPILDTSFIVGMIAHLKEIGRKQIRFNLDTLDDWNDSPTRNKSEVIIREIPHFTSFRSE